MNTEPDTAGNAEPEPELEPELEGGREREYVILADVPNEPDLWRAVGRIRSTKASDALEQYVAGDPASAPGHRYRVVASRNWATAWTVQIESRPEITITEVAQ